MGTGMTSWPFKTGSCPINPFNTSVTNGVSDKWDWDPKYPVLRGNGVGDEDDLVAMGSPTNCPQSLLGFETRMRLGTSATS